MKLHGRIDDAAAKLLALDADQLKLLDMAQENKRALVSGPAGCGKSVVARELCARWARGGSDVLYLCFTDALAAAIDRSFETERLGGTRVRAVSLGRYIIERLEACGRTAERESKDFWKLAPIEAGGYALPDPRPDAVVLDEAQDPDDETWQFIRQLTEGLPLWAFHDLRQRFWADRSIPRDLFDSAVHLNLMRQQRNPPDVERFAALYSGSPSTPASLPPSDKPFDPVVIRLSIAHANHEEDRVRHEVDCLVRDGAHPHDITIISLAGQTHSNLIHRKHLGSHPLFLADTAGAADGLIADTFLRFKGLERPIIIITELAAGHLSNYATRMHIALTRSTVRVIIVGDEATMNRDPRLHLLSRVERPNPAAPR